MTVRLIRKHVLKQFKKNLINICSRKMTSGQCSLLSRTVVQKYNLTRQTKRKIVKNYFTLKVTVSVNSHYCTKHIAQPQPNVLRSVPFSAYQATSSMKYYKTLSNVQYNQAKSRLKELNFFNIQDQRRKRNLLIMLCLCDMRRVMSCFERVRIAWRFLLLPQEG